MAKIYKFDSGLTILYEKNNINKSTSIELSFDCGAMCDDKLPGLAHFCEHMFFTGTDKLSKQEVSKRYFDFIRVNAYTGREDIVFTGNIVTAKLPNYLYTVYDMICNSTFEPSAVEEEKKIVIQEIVQDADSHSKHANCARNYDLYRLDNYKFSVLGTKETVSRIKSTDVKKYIKKYFVKNNCYISICSPLSFGKVKSIVKKNFEELMPSNNLKPLNYGYEKLIETESVNLHNVDIDKNFFSITFKFKKKGPDLKYKILMGIISHIIDDFSDGLTKELRLDNSLVYSMGADYMINKANSYLVLYTEISRQNIKPCLDIMLEYISKIVETGFTKEQFKKELEKDEYYWQTIVNSPNNIIDNLNRYRFYRSFISDRDIHNGVQNATLEEVNQLLKELFSESKIQVFVYGNAEKKDIYTINQIKNKFKIK